MVKTEAGAKTSSRRMKFSESYKIAALATYHGILPKTTGIYEDASLGGQYIAGTVSRKRPDQTKWDLLPHVDFANLPTHNSTGAFDLSAIAIRDFSEQFGRPLDLATQKILLEEYRKPAQLHRLEVKAVERFLSTYGLLYEDARIDLAKDTESEKRLIQMERRRMKTADVTDVPIQNDDFAIFRETIDKIATAQNLLRLAWKGDPDALNVHIKTELDSGFEIVAFDVRPDIAGRKGEALLQTDDLWAFICYLVLLDHVHDRTGFCANPECVAPYYLKRRRTQVICEAGPCTAWAQRQYALKWWNTVGSKRRKRKQNQIAKHKTTATKKK